MADPPPRQATSPYRVAGDVDAAPHDVALVDTWAVDERCPRCRVPLFAGSKRGITVFACGECGGLWVRNADMIRILQTRDPAAIDLDAIAMQHRSARPLPAPFTCCECPDPLTRHVVARVIIAVCQSHGTWFDRGHLSALMKQITAAEDASFETAAAEGEEIANAETAARTLR